MIHGRNKGAAAAAAAAMVATHVIVLSVYWIVRIVWSVTRLESRVGITNLHGHDVPVCYKAAAWPTSQVKYSFWVAYKL
jgi:hypothetical protein